MQRLSVNLEDHTFRRIKAHAQREGISLSKAVISLLEKTENSTGLSEPTTAYRATPKPRKDKTFCKNPATGLEVYTGPLRTPIPSNAAALLEEEENLTRLADAS